MCGIAGLWGVDEATVSASVASMLREMRHRGPDGSGMVTFRRGGVGMVRLSLVDLSKNGQQPFMSADGKVAFIFNGEMYNYREHRQRLAEQGYVFRSSSDAEVAFALYLERGVEFVKAIRGMFAIAIIDGRGLPRSAQPAVHLFRDAFGIKPLLFAWNPNVRSLVFASEIRSILASGLIVPELNRQALADYLTFGFVPQPATMLKNVEMLEPGQRMSFDCEGEVQTERFFRMPDYAPRRDETLDDAAARLRATLEESVKIHAVADAPVGAFLSGGVDSTAIVALMRKHVADLRTYTVRFSDVSDVDESTFAKDAARHYQCTHTEVDVSTAEAAELVPRFAGDLDQPSVDGFNTWIVSRAASRDVKAVLSGVGGDELFAGYPVTGRMVRNSRRRGKRILRVAAHVADHIDRRLPLKLRSPQLGQLASRRSPLALWAAAHQVFPRRVASALAGVQFNEDAPAVVARTIAQRAGSINERSGIDISFHADTSFYMANQLLRDADMASMAHSLELRVPFVDLEMLQFSRTCLNEYKLFQNPHGSSTYATSGAKRVLIHAMADLLPKAIENREKKGFSLPYEAWLRSSTARQLSAESIEQMLACRGLVEPAPLRRLVPVRKHKKINVYPQQWAITILNSWISSIFDKDWRLRADLAREADSLPVKRLN